MVSENSSLYGITHSCMKVEKCSYQRPDIDNWNNKEMRKSADEKELTITIGTARKLGNCSWKRSENDNQNRHQLHWTCYLLTQWHIITLIKLYQQVHTSAEGRIRRYRSLYREMVSIAYDWVVQKVSGKSSSPYQETAVFFQKNCTLTMTLHNYRSNTRMKTWYIIIWAISLIYLCQLSLFPQSIVNSTEGADNSSCK